MKSRAHVGEKLVNRAWENARAVAGFDSAEWRQDECGAWIRRDEYDHHHPASEFGWRILDVVANHKNEPDTLRAFHVRNTFDVAQGRPVCRVHADREHLAAGSAVRDPRNIEPGE
jgi:hypothetical protein